MKSGVVDNETGEERDSEVRTSSGTFFDKGADEVRAAGAAGHKGGGRGGSGCCCNITAYKRGWMACNRL